MIYSISRLHRRAWLLLLALFYLSTCTTAQLGPSPRPVDVVINVFIDRMPNRAPQGLSIQLQSGMGSNEAELKTDGNGTAQCHSLTGTHRLHIFGPNVQEYQE